MGTLRAHTLVLMLMLPSFDDDAGLSAFRERPGFCAPGTESLQSGDGTQPLRQTRCGTSPLCGVVGVLSQIMALNKCALRGPCLFCTSKRWVASCYRFNRTDSALDDRDFVQGRFSAANWHTLAA